MNLKVTVLVSLCLLGMNFANNDHLRFLQKNSESKPQEKSQLSEDELADLKSSLIIFKDVNDKAINFLGNPKINVGDTKNQATTNCPINTLVMFIENLIIDSKDSTQSSAMDILKKLNEFIPKDLKLRAVYDKKFSEVKEKLSEIVNKYDSQIKAIKEENAKLIALSSEINKAKIDLNIKKIDEITRILASESDELINNNKERLKDLAAIGANQIMELFDDFFQIIYGNEKSQGEFLSKINSYLAELNLLESKLTLRNISEKKQRELN